MTARRLLLFLLGGIAALVGGPATLAQDRPVSPNRATFFTEPNYAGEALVIEAGASVARLDELRRPDGTNWAFAISSIRVEGAARATVFASPGLGGERLDVTASIPDLFAVNRTGGPAATWDRTIASVTVGGPAALPTPGPATVVPSPSAPVVIVPGPPGSRRETRPRYDRRTAELVVQRAFQEVLNRPPDPEGLRTYRDRLMYQGWSERDVIEQLQRSREARAVNADEAITRAYREVLGRDPDAAGLAHYRAKWRDGWTQGRIRDDLRRSLEGRDQRVRDVITRAYRDLLGREPDAQGFATYERLMRDRGYTERDIRQAIMAGDEYRRRVNPR